jgi:transaldolase/glucose-6-phosphate isomerase
MAETKTTNPLLELAAAGQSVWYDNIRRGLLVSGELKALVDDDGVAGVTSNPAIFEKAITGSSDYDSALRAIVGDGDMDAKDIYEKLAIEDIRTTADVLRPTHDRTAARDGYVSLEVSPYLAHDTAATVAEARRLWRAVDRPNVMIKVPGTPAGVPAIRQLIASGINVNVTLLFSLAAYEAAAEAFIAGIEDRVKAGGDVSRVASVASFFVSRIDTLVDDMLAKKIEAAKSPDEKARCQALLGKVAIANAKLAYVRYGELFATPRWKALASRGPQTQRVLWASTSTKNPAYRDVIYAEELIGRDTVDTMPAQTVTAFRDHGRVRPSLEEDVPGARATMAALAGVGISMDAATGKLLEDAVRLFADPFDKLLGAIERQRQSLLGARLNPMTHALPGSLGADVKATLETWRARGNVRRLWAKDATLWTGLGEEAWLGWLDIVSQQVEKLGELRAFASEVKQRGFRHVLLLGMGGSSLAPEVLRMTFGVVPGFPELLVLDSTDPQQVATFERKVDLARTLFIVASKSGSTLEPNIFKQYFFERVKQAVGEKEAGSRFVAITDPGSKMEEVARRDGFWRIFSGVPSIGGRYSALSMFGLVPAAAMGLDVGRFLEATQAMVRSCSAFSPPAENPGVVLGTILGVAGKAGRDKVTVVASAGAWDVGAWLEQLLAESTGKLGKGLIPVDLEQVGPPSVYGDDRVFVHVRLEGDADARQEEAVGALERAGHPVVRIRIADPIQLGQEMFRWEIATAVAGAILGINPFDQPDVEAAKIAARKLTSDYEKTGTLPPETPLHAGDGTWLFADDRNGAELRRLAGNDRSLAGYLRAHLSRLGPGDYACISAYVEMNEANLAALQRLRHAIRDSRKVATCLGFGPRFLHSTGQAYKGGPNTGVFLQITCDAAADVKVPGQSYTFGVVKASQARGDFEVLAERGRRLLRIHLGKDVPAALAALTNSAQG